MMQRLVAGGPQAISDLIGRQAVHANHFVPAGLTRGYGNGRSRDFQKIRQQLDARLIRPPIGRRRRDRDLERVSLFRR